MQSSKITVRTHWIAKKIKDYYITYTKKDIIQKKNSYTTTKWRLTDAAIYDHIKKKQPIGILSGNFITKFLTFDDDSKDYADTMTLELVNTLAYEFDIAFENILVTFSGNKGYHVTIFFDDVIDVNL